MNNIPNWALYAMERQRELAATNTGLVIPEGSSSIRQDELVCWLKNDTLKSCYRAWIDHPRIGPKADGDGDIVSWSLEAIDICLRDFLFTDEQSPLSRQAFERQLLEPPKASGLLDYLRWIGVTRFRGAFNGCEGAPHESWAQHYGMLERSIRALWGGRCVRVHARPKALKDPDQLVREALVQGVPIQEIPLRIGLSRATVYRILKRFD